MSGAASDPAAAEPAEIGTGPATRTVTVEGRTCRVWEKGQGRPIYWLASSPMLLRWTEVHEALAAKARLVVCSLPGFPGSGGHETIDDHLTWCVAARDLLAAAGFSPGDVLMGSSTAGALAAEVAALWPDWVGKLVLVAPFGVFDVAEPTRDMFALHPKQAARMLSEREATYRSQIAVPDGHEPVLWNITVVQGNAAAARFLWPLGNTKIVERLHRIAAPTLVVWGEADRILPPSYAERFASAIGDNARVVKLPAAGHLAELDCPNDFGDAVLAFAA